MLVWAHSIFQLNFINNGQNSSLEQIESSIYLHAFFFKTSPDKIPIKIQYSPSSTSLRREAIEKKEEKKKEHCPCEDLVVVYENPRGRGGVHRPRTELEGWFFL